MPKEVGKKLRYFTVAVIAAILIFAIYGYFNKSHDNGDSSAGQTIESTSVEELATKIINGDQFLLLDLRSRNEFATSHIPGSVSLPHYEISLKDDELAQFSDWDTILVCASSDCANLERAVRDLQQLGYLTISALEGGFVAYAQAELGLASQAQLVQQDLVDLLKSIDVESIKMEELQSLISEEKTMTIIDTRSPYEFIAGFISGAVNIPLHSVGAAFEQGLINTDLPIYIYDSAGNLSPIAVQALTQAGVSSVYDLEGGLEAWKALEGELEIPAADGSNLDELIPVLNP